MDEDKPFAGHAAIVTGATRENDRAIVLKLARRGAAVAFNYAQSVKAAAEFNGGIEALGIIPVPCHVAQTEDVKGLYNACKETFGRIDFLVNNAGITRDNPIPSVREEDWYVVIDTNLKGALRAACSS